MVYMCDDVIEHEETERKQWENNIYYMRYWLRLSIVQLIVASYPEPYEHIEVMLKTWGDDHNTFNSAQDWWINPKVLNEILSKQISTWLPFSNKEFKRTIIKYSNSFTSGLNCISWKHLKAVIKDKKCFKNIINITNIYINLQYLLAHFKESFSIIILKPNKVSYNFSKIFCSIVLLNTLEKLIQKVIGVHFQFYAISINFIYPNQLEGLKQ